jgi:hypothetical protein
VQFSLQTSKAHFPKKIAGVAGTLGPGVFYRLRKLPGQEAWTKPFAHWLGLSGTFVMAKAEIREPQSRGEHPAVTVILGTERCNTPLPVATVGSNGVLEVLEGGQGQDGMTQLGVFVLVDAPEAFGVQGTIEGPVTEA